MPIGSQTPSTALSSAALACRKLYVRSMPSWRASLEGKRPRNGRREYRQSPPLPPSPLLPRGRVDILTEQRQVSRPLPVSAVPPARVAAPSPATFCHAAAVAGKPAPAIFCPCPLGARFKRIFDMPGLAKLAAQLRLDRTVAAAALLSVTALIASSTPSAAFVETARQADWVHATHSHHDHHAPAGANTIGRGIGGLHGRLAANQPVEEAAGVLRRSLQVLRRIERHLPRLRRLRARLSLM